MKLWLNETYRDLFLYYVKGIEDGPRIEKRMLKFQKRFEAWMKREGVALIAQPQPEGGFTLSFAPEKIWDRDMETLKEMQNQPIPSNLLETLQAEGDKIN